MSSKERFLYLAIAFFGVYYLINMYSSNEESYVFEYNSKIEALESKIDSLHNINDGLEYKIDTLNQKIFKLDKAIYLQNNKIITLKKQTNKKTLVDTRDSSFLSPSPNIRSLITSFNSILFNNNNQFELSQELNKKLKLSLKKQRLKTKLTGGAGIIAIVGVILLLK